MWWHIHSLCPDKLCQLNWPWPQKNTILNYHHQFLSVHISLDTLLISCLLEYSMDLQWPSSQESLRLGSKFVATDTISNIGDTYYFSPTDSPLVDPCQWDTVRCCFNIVNFHPNSHKTHPIAHPLGWGMGWFYTLIYTMLQSMQCCMKYLVTSL